MKASITKAQSMAAFSLASAILAGIGFFISWRIDTVPHDNLLTPAVDGLPFGVGWSICVYYAYKMHGKRALWLLAGFPFAWFYVVITALFALRALTGGGV
jgi:hypothetical protein